MILDIIDLKESFKWNSVLKNLKIKNNKLNEFNNNFSSIKLNISEIN